jgi:hypothetical protein
MKDLLLFCIILVVALLEGCQSKTMKTLPHEVFTYNASGRGTEITIEFTRGKAFNHPLMAVWVEDEKGNFVQTLYVAESIGKGVFQHGDNSSGKWIPGEIRRPAALPYWAHRRGIKASDGLYIPKRENPIPDAYTGPTPIGNFVLNTSLDKNKLQKFTVYFEINQTWDWNEYWTNSKYPEDEDYKTSCQPSLVYKADFNADSPQKEYQMKVVGHGHYSGKTGELFTDLSTITTALQIAGEIKVRVK